MTERDRAAVRVELLAEWSTPSSRQTGSTCAAKASFNSITSTSSIVMPARSSTFRTAPIGPTPMISGSTPDTEDAMIRARGSIPARARFGHHDDRRGAVVQGQEFPAVTFPPGLSRIELRERLERRPPPRPVVGGDPPQGAISRPKKPESCAATARSCERCANRSMSSRETSQRSATFSAVSPIGM